MFPVSCNCLNGVSCPLETGQIVLRNSLKDESYIYIWLKIKRFHFSGHSQSIQLDKSYSITSNTVVIKSSRIFARSAYKCTKMSPWFCHAGATRNPSATILFYSIYTVKVKIKPLMVFAFLNTSQRFCSAMKQIKCTFPHFLLIPMPWLALTLWYHAMMINLYAGRLFG